MFTYYKIQNELKSTVKHKLPRSAWRSISYSFSLILTSRFSSKSIYERSDNPTKVSYVY